MNWWEDCLASLKAEGLGPPCQDHECVDMLIAPHMQQLCLEVTPLWPFQCFECYSEVLGTSYFKAVSAAEQVIDCQRKAEAEPQNNWGPRLCYCCCFNHPGLALRTAAGVKAVDTLTTDDHVLALEDPAGLASGSPAWSAQPVVFTGGAGPETAPAAIALRYGDDGHALVPGEQLVLTAEGTLKSASRLVPGQDAVRLADGSVAPVTRVARGTFPRGVRHVAASSTAFDGTPRGHLLDAQGLVVGDYVLQLNARALAPELLAPGHWDLPELGTPAYAEAYPSLDARSGVSATVRAPA